MIFDTIRSVHHCYSGFSKINITCMIPKSREVLVYFYNRNKFKTFQSTQLFAKNILKIKSLCFTIDLVSEGRRASERNDPPVSQCQVLSGRRIPAYSFSLFIYTEFSESGKEHILTGHKGVFHDLQHRFDKMAGLVF